jgi:hypothetical protein
MGLAAGGLPVWLGAENLGGAIGVGDLKLTKVGGLGAVVVALAYKAETAAVPSITQLNTPGILALNQQVGDVLGDNRNAVPVAGPARVEDVLGNCLAV